MKKIYQVAYVWDQEDILGRFKNISTLHKWLKEELLKENELREWNPEDLATISNYVITEEPVVKLLKTVYDEYGYQEQKEFFFPRNVVEEYALKNEYESLEEFLDDYVSDDTEELQQRIISAEIIMN